MSKKTILKGTLILTITGILTKCLGFYNRIFLTRLIGVKELGTYQLIFPLYILGISFCYQGVATTVTKHVSYLRGRGNSTDPRRILHIGWGFAVTASFVSAWVFWTFCGFISAHILQNTDCEILLKTLAPALPFVAVKACINAYFIGYSNPVYAGTCQLAEQIVRIGSVYLLASLRLHGAVGAQTAVFGVVIGEIAATVYAVCAYRLFRRRNHLSSSVSVKKTSEKNLRATVGSMWKDILPITGSNLILTLFSSYEAIILPGYLYRFFGDGNRSMELYGIVSGIVVPFLLFPATITGSLSTMLLPSVSYACAEKNPAAIKKALRYSALFCVTLGIFAWIFYLQFGSRLCLIAFQNAEAGKLLRRMAFLCPLIYLSGTLSGTLTGMGYASSNLLYSILGISVRITCILFLVPHIGIDGYILGMAGGYLLQNLAALIRSLSVSSHTGCSGKHSNSASSHTGYLHGSART